MENSSTAVQLRASLSDAEKIATEGFEILQKITSLVNERESHNLGREMVIRALAMQDRFPPEYNVVLQSLVKTVGLLPYLDKGAELDFQDTMLLEAHKPPFKDTNLLFHTLQLQIYRDILAGKNVVLSASTSVGKSLVVDAIIASRKHRHIAIIVPTIALIDETRRRISKRFGSEFDLITHPTQASTSSRQTIFVLTQERALARKDLDQVSFFVIDEFYKIDLQRDQSDRTVDLNLCFHHLAKSGAQFYLIGPNIDAVTGLGGSYEYTFIPSQFSTVALDIIEYDLPRDDDVRCGKLLELLPTLETPTLVYCQSPTKAALVAEALIKSKMTTENSTVLEAVDWLAREFPEEWVFIRALRAGIGIHHGNIPRALQQYVVRAFELGHIKTIICTSTIIEGVNTVAENVIIYDRRSGSAGTPILDNFTFKNIAGRAGRMTKYFIGKVFVLETVPKEEEIYSVQVGVDTQSYTTPFSYVLDLPSEDLQPISQQRLDDVSLESPLSLATLRSNRHIPVEDQYAVHEAISADLLLLEDALVWKGMPAPHQLLAVCELIYDYIDRGRSLGNYGIKSGRGLKAELDRLRMSRSFRPILDHWIENREYLGSTSNSVENALRFLRRYVSYTFPRQLMAVSRIQSEIYQAAGRTNLGDYGLFAAKAESLFMEAGLFALDEYGVPPELARRIGVGRGEIRTLDEGLQLLREIDIERSSLHPFEREVLLDVVGSIGD